jgi:hypothetical protein
MNRHNADSSSRNNERSYSLFRVYDWGEVAENRIIYIGLPDEAPDYLEELADGLALEYAFNMQDIPDANRVYKRRFDLSKVEPGADASYTLCIKPRHFDRTYRVLSWICFVVDDDSMDMILLYPSKHYDERILSAFPDTPERIQRLWIQKQ